METSEDYSPIADIQERVNREAAYPYLESIISSVLSTFNDYLSLRKLIYFRNWKKNSVSQYQNQLKVFNDFCFIAAQKARLGQRHLKNLIQSQYSKALTQIIFTSEAESLDYEAQYQDLKIKKAEIERLKNENKKEKSRLEEVNERVKEAMKVNSDFIINEMKMLKEENIQLQDKLLTYEIHFGNYIRETELLLRNSKISIH